MQRRFPPNPQRIPAGNRHHLPAQAPAHTPFSLENTGSYTLRELSGITFEPNGGVLNGGNTAATDANGRLAVADLNIELAREASDTAIYRQALRRAQDRQ